MFRISCVPSQSEEEEEEEGVQVERGWCLEDGGSTAWEEYTEGEEGLCGSVSTKAGEAVVRRSLSFVPSFPAPRSLLASLL